MTTMKINEKKNTIEITKTFAQKAARVGSPEYFELLEVRHNFPKFKVRQLFHTYVIQEIEKT